MTDHQGPRPWDGGEASPAPTGARPPSAAESDPGSEEREAAKSELEEGAVVAGERGVSPGVRRLGIHVLAFGAGFAVMAIEVAGARLIAPVFGLSAVPWTAVIGVILAALAAGNHFGGRLADAARVPLAAVLAASGATALVPVLSGGVPRWAAATFGFVPGALVSAALLFAPAVLALGAVLPYLIKADTRSVETVGRRAGDVSASATLGSIAGTFVTGFVLLPLVSLPVLLGVVAATLLGLAALASVVLAEGIPPRTLLVAGIGAVSLGIVGTRERPGTLHGEETIHGSLRVTETRWSDGRLVRELWQNGGSSSAEEVGSGRPAHPYALRSLQLLGAVGRPIDSVLVLGGAALTLPLALVGALPGAQVDVVELDPAATRLARRYFAYGREQVAERLRVHHGDARLYLSTSGGRYDLIYMDVFDHLATVPWTLVTVEALSLARDQLSEDGFLMINVLSPLEGGGTAFLRRFLGTLERVFGAVRVYPVSPELDPLATQNVLILAAPSASRLPSWGQLQVVLPADRPPLTDSHAPVEYLQAKVFLEGLRWR